MQDFLERCTAVVRRVLFIGFGIQIVLGILWMCNAFVRWDSLGEGIVCVMEMAALGGAVAFLLKRGQGLALGLFEVLGVLTFPMVLQCLMEPNMRVFASALLLLQTGAVLRAVKSRTDREFWVAWGTSLVAWMAAGLLMGEYLYFGMVPMVVGLFCIGRSKRKNLWNHIVLVLATAGIIFGVGSFYQERARLMPCLVSRISWTTLYDSYDQMSEERNSLINYNKMIDSTYDVAGIEEVLIPSLERKLNKEELEELLRELMATSWRNNKKRILKEIAWDMAGYTAAPMVLPMQLQGRAYDSLSGINYRQILLPAPRLGKLYMDYGCWWFVVALALRAAMALIARRRPPRAAFMAWTLTAFTMAFGYTMSGAGKMDYKNMLFILCGWLVWVVAAMGAGGNGRKSDEDA